MSVITSLQVPKSLCPLVDVSGGSRKCYFSLLDQIIWKQGDLPIAKPVALSADNLTLKIKAQTPGTYKVSAQIGTDVIVAEVQKTFAKDTAVEVPLTLPGNKLPCSLRGTLHWTLKDVSGQSEASVSMQVEIYVLQSPLPRYFDDAGIPLPLLRLEPLMTEWRASAEKDWSVYTTRHIYGETRLEYDTWKGISKYTSNPSEIEVHSSLGVEIKTLWLDLWLSDMEGLRQRKDTKSRYGVNCYDTAALVQVICSLGTPFQTLRMKYMEPFGYLAPTLLLGQAGPDGNEKCNNPYFGSPGHAPEKLCPPEQSDRSKVENHMFLTRQNDPLPKVFDACCGPSVGETSIDEYPSLAIDTKRPRDDIEPSGDISNIYDGPGVRDLAVSAVVQGNNSSNTAPDTLLGRLSEYLKGGGDIQSPYIGRLHNADVATATLTFNPSKSDVNGIPAYDLWTITIMRFKTLDETEIAYTQRKAAVDEAQELSPTEMMSDASRGGFTMFYDAKSCIVAVVESRFTKSKWLGALRSKMRTYMSMVKPDQPKFVQSWRLSQNPVTEQQTFTLTITPTLGTPKSLIVGYSVNTSYGNVLLLDTKIDDNAVVTMTFLARRGGTENVSVTLYGPDLLVEAALNVAVQIKSH